MGREVKEYFMEMKLQYEGEVEAACEEEAEMMFYDEWIKHGMHYAGTWSFEIEEGDTVRYICEARLCECEVEEDEELCDCCKECAEDSE